LFKCPDVEEFIKTYIIEKGDFKKDFKKNIKKLEENEQKIKEYEEKLKYLKEETRELINYKNNKECFDVKLKKTRIIKLSKKTIIISSSSNKQWHVYLFDENGKMKKQYVKIYRKYYNEGESFCIQVFRSKSFNDEFFIGKDYKYFADCITFAILYLTTEKTYYSKIIRKSDD